MFVPRRSRGSLSATTSIRRRPGREVHVANILTGHFLKQGDRLLITLEAIQVDGNRLLWQTNVTAPAQDLIALQAQMAAQMRQGLLPALGAAGGFLDTGTRPKNAEAYDLYLHSLALPHDAGPNKDAIAVLEHVVEVDPTYAPAWEQLGLRCYYDADYSDGGEADVPAVQQGLRTRHCTRSESGGGRRPADHQPRGARRTGQGIPGGAGAGEAPSGKRRGPFRDGLCLSLCRDAGAIGE